MRFFSTSRKGKRSDEHLESSKVPVEKSVLEKREEREKKKEEENDQREETNNYNKMREKNKKNVYKWVER